MPGPPGRAAARGQWRRSTVGNDGPAVGSGWQRHNAADGFGCFGTQTAPPTCSDGRREQTGCSAVRLAHLLWEQGVAGSNPVSPTIDNQPLVATQVVFYWGRRHTIYTQNRRFSGCIRIGPRKSRISRLHQGRLPAKADFRPLAHSSPARFQSRQRTSSTRLRETDAPKHHRPGSPHRRRALATRATTNPCHHQPGGTRRAPSALRNPAAAEALVAPKPPPTRRSSSNVPKTSPPRNLAAAEALAVPRPGRPAALPPQLRKLPPTPRPRRPAARPLPPQNLRHPGSQPQPPPLPPGRSVSPRADAPPNPLRRLHRLEILRTVVAPVRRE